jgi:hypothetical protein
MMQNPDFNIGVNMGAKIAGIVQAIDANLYSVDSTPPD